MIVILTCDKHDWINYDWVTWWLHGDHSDLHPNWGSWGSPLAHGNLRRRKYFSHHFFRQACPTINLLTRSAFHILETPRHFLEGGFLRLKKTSEDLSLSQRFHAGDEVGGLKTWKKNSLIICFFEKVLLLVRQLMLTYWRTFSNDYSFSYTISQESFNRTSKLWVVWSKNHYVLSLSQK